LHEKLAVWTRVAAVLAAVAIGWLLYTIKSDLSAIGESLSMRPHSGEVTINTREASMISVTKSWVSDGQTITVTTTLGHGYLPGETIPGETLAQWKERHRLRVAEVQALFPPD
jgi:hypothetical protein